MNCQYLLVFSVLASLSITSKTEAQSSNYFSGYYIGLEIGTISYNTQITFDGVDDPAGRSGGGYGAFFGYNYTNTKLLVGAEILINFASKPGPYTFDPAVVGFAELDLQRGASAGLDFRVGYLVIDRILLYGNVGYSANKQSVHLDGVSLQQFAGGAAAEKFGAFQFGVGVEAAIHLKVSFRFSYRSLAGHDLNATDFGTIPIDASLTRFDVEPSQQQFLAAIVFRF